MSLSNYFGGKANTGGLALASSLRITAEYLGGLRGPSQTLILIEGFGAENQKNKQDRIPAGSSRAPRDLAWPVIRGRDIDVRDGFRSRPVTVMNEGGWKLHLFHEEWQLDGRRVFSELSMAKLDKTSESVQDQSTAALAAAA